MRENMILKRLINSCTTLHAFLGAEPATEEQTPVTQKWELIHHIHSSPDCWNVLESNVHEHSVGTQNRCKVFKEMKYASCHYEPAQNYHPTLQHIIGSFSLMFWFYGPWLYCFG